jgi:2-oxoglutarate/2-oxoacid ferredoxin oxidoreductase subunit beta
MTTAQDPRRASRGSRGARPPRGTRTPGAVPSRAPDASVPAATPRVVYRRPALLAEQPTHYCPGCGHGIIHRLVAEVLEELGIGERTILVGSVGCSVFAYDYLALDAVESPHGRAPAVATGVKRVRPDRIVFTYQGDGDLAAIGTAEIVHAAARGERITVVFVNNGIYGMTGGQMAPTTLPGQRTTSSPDGRDTSVTGYPLPVTELLALLPGVAFAARGSVADPGAIGRTRALLKRAFEVQLEGTGLGIVEVLSTCPVGWGMTPVEAMEHVATDVTAAYPLGVHADRGRGVAPVPARPAARPAPAAKTPAPAPGGSPDD